jgi:hypothetical protein
MMNQDYSKRFSRPSSEEQALYIGLIILDKVLNKGRSFSVLLEGDDTHLESAFEFLCEHSIMEVDDEKSEYSATNKGKSLYQTFLKKYEEYLRVYDVFCAVDLDQGVFGFEKMFDFDDADFKAYLDDEAFVDLRVTVCEYKEMNPQEIIFMGLLQEGRFREPKQCTEVLGQDSWQHKTAYGETFEELARILNLSPHYEELGYEDDEGVVDGEDVLEDIISQGVTLARKIFEKRASSHGNNLVRNSEQLENEEPIEIIETSVDPDYYDPYYDDPRYCSPLWDVALLSLILL